MHAVEEGIERTVDQFTRSYQDESLCSSYAEGEKEE